MLNKKSTVSGPKVICLSDFFSTDRVLFHSSFMENLAEFANPVIWSPATAEKSFPKKYQYIKEVEVLPLDEQPPLWLILLRHFEDYVWDHIGLSRSRESFWRLQRRKIAPIQERVLFGAARIFASENFAKWFEARLEKALIRYGKSPTALDRFQKERPSIVISMCPFRPSQMSIVAAAKALSIPTIAYITSWDNISTKTRLLYQYDAYIVWSEHMKRELHDFYPQSRSKPVYIIGAPQYDVFTQQQHFQTREEFFSGYKLNPELPLAVYCLGSPNLIREDYGALDFVERVGRQADLAQLQVLVRPHPGCYENGYSELNKIRERFPRVVVQDTHRHWQKFAFQNGESIKEWVNTVRHADVVVNLSSTIAVDAAIFDKPVVNLDFDPEPGSPKQQLIKEINHQWNHFKPIAESGGVWLANDMEEVINAVQTYLRSPDLHRNERRWIAQHVCGKVDGQSGARFANAVEDFAAQAERLVAWQVDYSPKFPRAHRAESPSRDLLLSQAEATNVIDI